jgi:co-chaperonin GroES (HSP10)
MLMTPISCRSGTLRKTGMDRAKPLSIRPDELKVSAGDVVVLAKYSGTEVKIEGEEHLIVDADDILGMMES